MYAVWLHKESQKSNPKGFAVVETDPDGKHKLHYVLKDHLGSWTTITDCNGVVEQELSFDAWGNRRNPENWLNTDQLPEPMFDRGFTGHEHLRGFGLINMNGRMYDPVMSSFLSVDRYVQQPENSQGFNRYAYCMYNPLKYVDPSGWRQSLPNGNGDAPPPDGDETGYYVTGVYTYTGFNNEYYSYNYGLNEVTVTPYGNSWAMEECRRLGEQNCGGLSAEISGGEANLPIISGCIGGGGGSGGAGYNNSSSGSNHMVSIQMATTIDGIVISNNIQYYKKYPNEVKDLGAKIKPGLKIGDPMKKASTRKIGERAVGRMRIANKVLGIAGVAISGIDIYTSGEINVSNGYNAVVAGLCLIPGAGWIIGGVSLTLDLAFYGFTGESFGDNLGHWFGDPSWKFPE